MPNSVFLFPGNSTIGGVLSTLGAMVGINNPNPAYPLEVVDTTGNWDQITVSDGLGNPRAFLGMATGGTLFSVWSLNQSSKTGLFDNTAKAMAAIGLNAANNDGSINFITSSTNNVNGVTRVTIDKNGNLNVITGGVYQAAGVSGVTAGPFTTITSITVKAGIVTTLTGS